MRTQLEHVYEHEKTRPNDIWLTQPLGGGRLRDFTFREVVGEARRMAAHLKSLDLPAKSSIAIFSKNTAWWLMADLAIWMAGHVSVPLYPILTPETIRQILEHSEAKLVFVGKLDNFATMEPGIPDGLARIAMPLAPSMDAPKWEDIVKATEPLAESPTRSADDVATIIYTSGSTGVPKGVMHSFRTMCASKQIIDELGIRADDRVLSYLPLAHALERVIVETPTFLVGFRVYFAESLQTFVKDIQRARPTLFVSVPRLWQKFQSGIFTKMPPKRLELLLKLPIVRGLIKKKILSGLGLQHVRFAGSGSAPIPKELIDWYRNLGLELLEGYGMTENFAISHFTRPGDVRPGYVGTVQPGVTCRISDEGEVLVRSPGTMLGYYKAPELTAEMLDSEGYLHTGDRGEVDEKGRLRITGRVKDLFKTSKGKYVAPVPIENALLTHDEVELACVSGANMPQPFAMVVLSEEARKRVREAAAKEPLAESLAAHLAQINASLDPHEQLEKLVVVEDEWTIENGLLTPTLKVKRSAVEGKYGHAVERWYEEKSAILWG